MSSNSNPGYTELLTFDEMYDPLTSFYVGDSKLGTINSTYIRSGISVYPIPNALVFEAGAQASSQNDGETPYTQTIWAAHSYAYELSLDSGALMELTLRDSSGYQHYVGTIDVSFALEHWDGAAWVTLKTYDENALNWPLHTEALIYQAEQDAGLYRVLGQGITTNGDIGFRATLSVSPVPEPSGVVFAVLAGLALTIRRGRTPLVA